MSESSLSTRWWNQTRLQRATEKTYLSQLAAAQVQPNLKMRIAGNPEAMPVSHQNHGSVPMAITIVPGFLSQAFDLGDSQMFTSPVGSIRLPLRHGAHVAFGALGANRGNQPDYLSSHSRLFL